MATADFSLPTNHIFQQLISGAVPVSRFDWTLSQFVVAPLTIGAAAFYPSNLPLSRRSDRPAKKMWARSTTMASPSLPPSMSAACLMRAKSRWGESIIALRGGTLMNLDCCDHLGEKIPQNVNCDYDAIWLKLWLRDW